jgi:RNA 3'-terminal phosphate cyclase
MYWVGVMRIDCKSGVYATHCSGLSAMAEITRGRAQALRLFCTSDTVRYRK